MSIPLLQLEKLWPDPAAPSCQVKSFGEVLRTEMGEPGWRQLQQDIISRFNVYVSEDKALTFTGKMQWVYCSPIGSIIAKVIKPFSILPDLCARGADFTFDIGLHDGEISKQRGYELGKQQFIFKSLFKDSPRLHEEFNGGIGMYLKLLVKRGSLLFRDQGYFFRIKSWRLSLPRWLTVGYFDLLHRNIDEQRFQIIIRVVHPLFGTLFYQRGEFERRLD